MSDPVSNPVNDEAAVVQDEQVEQVEQFAPTEIQEQIEDLSDLELMQSGDPIVFKIGDKEFAIRQLDPADLEMVRLQENIGYHLALEQPGMDSLAKMGVSDDARVERALVIAKLKQEHDAATDPDKRRELSDQIAEWSRPDNRTRAQEIADKHSRRYRDRWMVENLICYPNGTALSLDDRLLFKRPANMELARPACWKAIRLATSVPN